ncbi:MAG: hypothetical protein DRQ51_08620 [Gammaproteobacteria bacterium]|nr:MAG: hypothetical protein DRQ51_08620 [Gammaproteobacteria bacterium]
MKNLYDTALLDELEQDLSQDTGTPIDGFASEKIRMQKIAKYSLQKRELMSDMLNDRQFEVFLKKIQDNGLDAKKVIHNIFTQVGDGKLNLVLFS